MPAVSRARQLAVIGHLPARLEPGKLGQSRPQQLNGIPTVNRPVRSRYASASNKREACLGSRPAKRSLPSMSAWTPGRSHCWKCAYRPILLSDALRNAACMVDPAPHRPSLDFAVTRIGLTTRCGPCICFGSASESDEDVVGPDFAGVGLDPRLQRLIRHSSVRLARIAASVPGT
jgi:hypothetical protein